MRIELRHNDVNIEDGEVENMWSVLLPYLRDVEQILTNFQGITVRPVLGDVRGSSDRLCLVSIPCCSFTNMYMYLYTYLVMWMYSMYTVNAACAPEIPKGIILSSCDLVDDQSRCLVIVL